MCHHVWKYLGMVIEPTQVPVSKPYSCDTPGGKEREKKILAALRLAGVKNPPIFLLHFIRLTVSDLIFLLQK
jgi:hypothetical protein